MVKIEISGDTPIEVAVLVTILAREVERDVDVRELAEKISEISKAERWASKRPANNEASQIAGRNGYDGLTVEVTNRDKCEESR